MSAFCKVDWCMVPEPHKHRPPTAAEVAESVDTIRVSHPARCSWRKDIYDGCDCGVTAAVTALYDLMASGGPE